MCDFHKHESWVTPETSRFLSSRQVILPAGHSMPEHTTGSGREEVLVVLNGAINLAVAGESKVLYFGDTAFIPENTLHAVRNDSDDPAGYIYVVTKRSASTTTVNHH